MNANDQDVGPYRIDLVLAIWSRIARTAEALHGIGAIKATPDEMRLVVSATHEAGNAAIDHSCLTKTLRVLAHADGMHAGDWLRARAVDAQMPRRKPPAPLDLQLRLKGVQCSRIVGQLISREDGDVYRVTIRNTRGDVASVESSSFANALEGAIRMAGARSEGP